MTKEARELIQCAYERIKDPAHWTQRTRARNKIGLPVSVSSPDAVAFCALGALDRCAYDDPDLGVFLSEAIRWLNRNTPGRIGIAVTNDDDGHAAVCEMFQKTLAK